MSWSLAVHKDSGKVFVFSVMNDKPKNEGSVKSWGVTGAAFTIITKTDKRLVYAYADYQNGEGYIVAKDQKGLATLLTQLVGKDSSKADLPPPNFEEEEEDENVPPPPKKPKVETRPVGSFPPNLMSELSRHSEQLHPEGSHPLSGHR